MTTTTQMNGDLISELRESGCMVFIQHWRMDEEGNLLPLREIRDRGEHPSRFGGRTEVTIIRGNAEDLKEYLEDPTAHSDIEVVGIGSSECSKRDTFTKSLGVSIALGRALEEPKQEETTPELEPIENQHRLISGYCDLTQPEIDMMNEIKALGEKVGSLINALDEDGRCDGRWLAISRTELQKGFMFLTRAVAKPTTF
jgi:hypothetical protein